MVCVVLIELIQPADDFCRCATAAAVLTFASASFYRALSCIDAEQGWKDTWIHKHVGLHQPILNSLPESPCGYNAAETDVSPFYYEVILAR